MQKTITGAKIATEAINRATLSIMQVQAVGYVCN